MPFLTDSYSLASGQTDRYDYIQATEASVMQTLFQEYLAGIVAYNSLHEQNQLGIVDVEIAGGGDGHTFVLSILVTSGSEKAVWASSDVEDVHGVFWMGSDAEALGDYQEAAIAQLGTFGTTITLLAAGIAGAAKGTRFMAFLAGLAVTSPG